MKFYRGKRESSIHGKNVIRAYVSVYDTSKIGRHSLYRSNFSIFPLFLECVYLSSSARPFRERFEEFKRSEEESRINKLAPSPVRFGTARASVDR